MTPSTSRGTAASSLMRKPNEDIQLGLWRACMLHELAIRPIYPGELLRRIAERGHKVPSSVTYDGIAFMRKKGWAVGTGRIHSRGGEYMTITPAGQQRLDALRDQLAKMVHEMSEGSSMPTKGSKRAAIEALTDWLRNSEAEADKMRAAIVEIDELITQALGHR